MGVNLYSCISIVVHDLDSKEERINLRPPYHSPVIPNPSGKYGELRRSRIATEQLERRGRMTAEQYLFLNSVCLTLQCERKNKETVFDGNIPA